MSFEHRSDMSSRLMTLMMLALSGLAILHAVQGWLSEPTDNDDSDTELAVYLIQAIHRI
jgi:hypothetical protein